MHLERSPHKFLPRKRLRPPRVVSLDELPLLAAAEEDGSISEKEADAVSVADLLLLGREGVGDASHDAVTLVEVSWTIAVPDIVRAAERAGTLRKAGYAAYGAVAGTAIKIEVRERARLDGVEVYIVRPDDLPA